MLVSVGSIMLVSQWSVWIGLESVDKWGSVSWLVSRGFEIEGCGLVEEEGTWSGEAGEGMTVDWVEG
jgi:hypothetical protein